MLYANVFLSLSFRNLNYYLSNESHDELYLLNFIVKKSQLQIKIYKFQVKMCEFKVRICDLN